MKLVNAVAAPGRRGRCAAAPAGACAEGDQVRALPARQGRPAQARRRAGLQGARREGDQRLAQGRDLSRRPVRQGPADDGRPASSARWSWRWRTTARIARRLQAVRRARHSVPVRQPRARLARVRLALARRFSDDMVKKTGIRMLGLADNGIRHFTNSLRPIQSPDDMKGMKIRIQPSPVFMTLVESLGACASAIHGPSCRPRCRRRSSTARRTASPTSSPRACTSTRSTSRSTATSGQPPRLPGQRPLLPGADRRREEGRRRGRRRRPRRSTAT